MRTLIKDVKAHDGEIVEICGFVKQVRDKKIGRASCRERV